MKGWIALFLILVFVNSSFAQASDSAKASPKDTGHPKHIHPYPWPQKSMLYSAVLPGLGQAYNKSYWKIPIVYAGLGTCAYFFITNHSYFTTYNNALKDTNGSYYKLYGSSNLSTISAYYKRNYTICIIAAVAIYALNIVDANVDAQLHGFNVSDDISVNFNPQFAPVKTASLTTLLPGIGLKFKL